METFYSLDENSKPTHNNKFYTEEDAFSAAQKAATAFHQHVKVYLWKESRKIEYASVNEDGSIDMLVAPLVQAALNLETRGLIAEAKELNEVIGTAKPVFHFSGKMIVNVNKKPVTATYEIAVGVSDKQLDLMSLRVNGISENPEAISSVQDELRAKFDSNVDPKVEVQKVISGFIDSLVLCPFAYESEEAQKFRLI